MIYSFGKLYSFLKRTKVKQKFYYVGNMKMLIAGFLLLFIPLFSYCQKLEYSIMWKGDSIGYILINRTLTDSTEYHRVRSVSNFRVIFSFTTGYSGETLYKNGKLIKSSALNTMNGDVNGSALVEWLNDEYLMIIDGEKKTWTEPVTSTVGLLYFQEPRGLNEVFSERHGRYLKIENNGDNYVLTKPDDRINTYTYENGRCTKVEINNLLTNFSFHLIK